MNPLARLLTRTSVFATSLFLSATTFAQNDVLGPVPDISGGANPSDIRQVILDILQAVLSFMALVAVVVLVIAGIRLVVSQGDDTQREKARNAIFFVVIGLIVIVLSSAFVQFLSDVLVN